MKELRVRRNGSIRLPEELMDGLGIYPESKIVVSLEGDAIVIRKAAAEDDPFVKAAKGPDVSALDRIQQEQRDAKERAKSRFEELMKNPPEVKPEDNPDLWR